jgi:hypothetical protein
MFTALGCWLVSFAFRLRRESFACMLLLLARRFSALNSFSACWKCCTAPGRSPLDKPCCRAISDAELWPRSCSSHALLRGHAEPGSQASGHMFPNWLPPVRSLRSLSQHSCPRLPCNRSKQRQPVLHWQEPAFLRAAALTPLLNFIKSPPYPLPC